MIRILSLTLILTLAFAFSASAADKPNEKSESKSDVSDILDKLDYPELMVVPRASERLRMEAREESSNWYYSHWQIELAGAATLYNALTAQSKIRENLSPSDKNSSASAFLIGKAVGAGWIAAGVFIGLQYPYRSGVTQISKYEGKDPRSQVMRERLAEESLEAPARLMRPLEWVAMLTNFGANAAMGVYMTDEGRLTAGVAALLSLMPLLYEDHAVRVWEKHLEYKSKIYGPLTSVAPMFDRQSQKFVPALGLSWAF
jgi:hypothetical protein